MLKIITIWKKTIANIINLHSRYRITDYDESKQLFSFQCGVSGISFHKRIADIAEDLAFINELPPEQACYIGIIFGNISKIRNLKHRNVASNRKHIRNQFFVSEFSLTRDNNVIFINPISKEKCLIRIETLIASKDNIRLFTPINAFILGINYGRQELISKPISSAKIIPISILQSCA